MSKVKVLDEINNFAAYVKIPHLSLRSKIALKLFKINFFHIFCRIISLMFGNLSSQFRAKLTKPFHSHSYSQAKNVLNLKKTNKIIGKEHHSYQISKFLDFCNYSLRNEIRTKLLVSATQRIF